MRWVGPLAESQTRTAARAKSVAAKLLVNRWSGRAIRTFRPRQLEFHGVALNLADQAIADRVVASLFFKAYESAEIRYIERFLKGYSGTFVELGSSLGITSLIAARQLLPGSRMICVEANPGLAERLVTYLPPRLPRDIEAEVVSAAIAPVTGWVDFHVSEDSLASRLTEGSPRSDADQIQAITFDDLLSSRHVADDYFLLCDIEGAERYFIDSEESRALARCARVVIELHDSGGISGMCVDDLLSALRMKWGFDILARYGNVIAAERNGSFKSQ